VSEPRPAHPQHHHRRAAAAKVPTVVISVSDTRTLETDAAGARIGELLHAAGHPVVAREVVPDEPSRIREALARRLREEGVRAGVRSGGTGVAPRDVTPETVEPLLERIVPGFGELFRMLSWQDVGSAALLSRALAGIAGGRVVFVLPGSRAAVELALEKLILPELGHLASEAIKIR
jgi:molybdenum cofactor biosynthesis protein B